MRRFLPIKIHHIYYSSGWWWGEKFYFFSRKYGLDIVPMAREYLGAVYANNYRRIGDGAISSWDITRQKENNEDLH